jgi:hypothetical protein
VSTDLAALRERIESGDGRAGDAVDLAGWLVADEVAAMSRQERLAQEMLATRVDVVRGRGLGSADDVAAAAADLADLAGDLDKLSRNPNMPGVESEPEDVQGGRSVLVRLDTVRPERVTWLWPGRIPFGKLTVLDGDPGKGKSVISVDLAARVTVGTSMPGETLGRAPAGVVVLSAEDGLADTIRPRLEAAGGDSSRVVALDAVRLPSGACRMPTLADVENLREAISAVKARLVVVDPVMAYLGSKDGHKDQDVRSLAHPIAHLAEETGAAVLLIRHLTKGEKASPIYRGGGSIGIAGAARSVLLVAEDREDSGLRVLASVKSNLSASPSSLTYRLIPENDVVRVSWQGAVNVTAAALLAAQGTDEEAGGVAGAEAFLRELLADGPVPSRDVFLQARQAGISEITLKRAKASIGVKAHKAGGHFGGDPGWYWELPSAEGDHSRLKRLTDQHDPLHGEVIPFSSQPGNEDP